MQPAEIMEAAVDPLQSGQRELLSHLFFEAASDAVVIIDADGLIVHLNAQTEELFGYPREELLNQRIEILVPKRLRARHVEHRRAYFRNPLPRTMGSNFRAIGLRKDGTEFPIGIALSPLPTESGLFVATAVRDMTSLLRLEDELRQRMCELEDADRHKDNFLTTLAHELSSPLAAVAYCAEMLGRSDIAPEVRLEAAKIVLEQVNFTRRLLEDLSELSTVRRGGLPLHMAPTDLAEVVRRSVDTSRPLLERHGSDLEIVLPASPIRVRGDAARLAQIVTNLLTNAARYTPDGGRIRLSVHLEEGRAVLKVKDNGIGIPQEMLTRVFEMFTRIESAKQRYAAGMGIGLAYVRRLVEIHGGSVEALSEGEGLGSEFVVCLPLSEGAHLAG
jgi:PAS domain S-box-containing protein